MSHATLETPDLERQIDYFTQVVGLQDASRENGTAFLATKVGDLVVRVEKGSEAKCARIAFQVDPATDFKDIRKGLEAEGVKVKESNDAAPGVPKMVSFEDPKGTVLEVTAAVSRRRSVRSQNPVGKTVPVTCRDWEKALPDARWRARIRGTQRGAQRQLQAWPLHRRDDRLSSVAERDDLRSEGVDQDAPRPALIACKPNLGVTPICRRCVRHRALWSRCRSHPSGDTGERDQHIRNCQAEPLAFAVAFIFTVVAG